MQLNFLARGFFDLPGRHIEDFLVDRQGFHRFLESLWRCRLLEECKQFADLAQRGRRFFAKRLGDALLGAEQVRE